MYRLECREVGFDCSHTMTGNTEEEVLQKAKEHGTHEHNLKESEIQNQISAFISIDGRDTTPIFLFDLSVFFAPTFLDHFVGVTKSSR
jgi:predicted small metal-binding protein